MMADIFVALPNHVVASHPHAAIDLESYLRARFTHFDFRIEQGACFECKRVSTLATGAELDQVASIAQEWLERR